MIVKIERERKFLISGVMIPSSWPVDFTITKITQTYLRQTRSEVTERVRVSEVDGQVSIILCMKEHLGPGENLESETTVVDISTVEWLTLQEKADPTRGTITKTRYTFDWNDLTYELDIFQEPRLVYALLEVELDDLTQDVLIPPFLLTRTSGTREVTGEIEWTNHHIALSASDIHL